MMKKSTLLLLSMAIAGSSIGQNRAVLQSSIANMSIKVSKLAVGNETIEAGANSPAAAGEPGDFAEDIVGDTEYDLQTNSSLCNRIVNHTDGISVVWTMAQTGGTFLDRGTGYNYWDNLLEAWGEQPTARIESDRTGWPSIAVTADGGEHIIAHNTNTNNLAISTRASAGTGSWTTTETLLPPVVADGNYWPRMVSSGADGNSLHVLSISYPQDPITEDFILYEGQAGAICYSRSTDSGSSFDKVHQVIDDIDSTFYFGFSSDDYAIDADGDEIGILIGGLATGMILLRSSDNGDTWAKTVVDTFPIPKYNYKTMISDIDGDMIADTIDCNDGSVSLLIDASGVTHCFWGLTSMLDDVIDEGIGYFPGRDGLAYWNDSRAIGDVDTIAFVVDQNGNGELDLPTGGTSTFPFGSYGTGLTSQPSAGIDEDGTLYLSYSSVVDASDDGSGRALRHTYLIESTDNGDSWSDPEDIYEDDFTECVFASIARKVDDCVHVLYLRDDQGGHSLSEDAAGNPTDPGNSGGDIVYTCVPRKAVGIQENIPLQSSLTAYSVYPNPFEGETQLFINLKEKTRITADVVDLTGRKVLELVNDEINSGRHTYTVNLENVTTGIYFVNLRLNNELYSQKVVKF